MLTVVREIEPSGTNRRFTCRCACGVETVKFLTNLRLGRSTSCGCSYTFGAAARAAIVAERHGRARITEDGRLCLTCDEWKAWGAFSPSSKGPLGRASNCMSCSKWRTIQATYGIGRQDWEWLLAEQGGGCALCFGSRKLSVDHDHSCCGPKRACRRCVRGLLCSDCNRMLGLIERRLPLRQRFEDYLDQRRPFATQSGVATPTLPPSQWQVRR